MTIYDFLTYVMDEQKLEVFNTNTGETLFEGYADELPEELFELEFGSVDAYNSTLTFNI